MVGPDHAVYVFWWDFTKGPQIEMRKSTDQGVTFGDTMIVTGLKTHGQNGDLGLTDATGRSFQTNAFPQAAVNPVTGDIYVVFDDQANGSADKADVYFTQSTDGGKHWSQPTRVNDDATNNDQWQPALALTPDGSHLGIFWYDRRLDPADNLIDRFGTIGTVSGHTVQFGANFRVTDVSFPPVFGQDVSLPPRNMGDYDVAVANNNYFYTTWGDNRLGDVFHPNQPDVRFAKIPVPGEATDLTVAVAVRENPSGQLLAGTTLLPSLSQPLPSSNEAGGIVTALFGIDVNDVGLGCSPLDFSGRQLGNGGDNESSARLAFGNGNALTNDWEPEGGGNEALAAAVSPLSLD
jgi:hypothetical protein